MLNVIVSTHHLFFCLRNTVRGHKFTLKDGMTATLLVLHCDDLQLYDTLCLADVNLSVSSSSTALMLASFRTKRVLRGRQITLSEDTDFLGQERPCYRMEHTLVIEKSKVSFIPVDRIH